MKSEMVELDFQKASSEALRAFQSGEFERARSLYAGMRTNFPGNRTEIDYMRSCLAVRLHDHPSAIEIIEGLLAEGLWLSEALLRKSPSFQPLQGDLKFEALVRRHTELRAGDSDAGGEAMLVAVPQRFTNPLPAIILLHGNGSSARDESAYWGLAVEMGWLVAAPNSKEAFWAGGGSFWSDHASAREQLKTHLAHLGRSYRLDPSMTILAGFSMGADIALAESLKAELLQAAHFILLAPGGPMFDEPASLDPLISRASGRDLNGVILMSEADDAIEPDKVRRVVDQLNAGGIETRLQIYPDQGHVYPDDFATRLGVLLGSFV